MARSRFMHFPHKMMMRHEIPYYQPNGKLCFFDKAELDAWMKRVRVKPQYETDSEATAYIVNRELQTKY